MRTHKQYTAPTKINGRVNWNEMAHMYPSCACGNRDRIRKGW